MNVLSLFDGMSCGQLALQRAGIKVDKYYASEIDKYAIQVTQNNFPNTIQLGNINNWREWNIDWKSVDLLLAGFCCQSWSMAGKQQGDKDPRGQLMWVMLDILHHIQKLNPNLIYLFENVKMKKEFKDYIDEAIGVKGFIINSALLSAQNRERNYWTNIPNVKQPQDKHINLSNILEDDKWVGSGAIRGRKLNKATILGRRLNEKGHRQDYDKTVPITQCLEVRNSNTDKSNCLTTVGKDNVLTPLYVGRYPDAYKNNLPFRYYTVKECERLQTLSDNYTEYGSYIPNINPNKCAKQDVIAIIENNNKFYVGSNWCNNPQDICPRGDLPSGIGYEKCIDICKQSNHAEVNACIKAGKNANGGTLYLIGHTYCCYSCKDVMDKYGISKVIIGEYPKVKISDSQRYKMLGNGWTVDVIAHIFSYLNLIK